MKCPNCGSEMVQTNTGFLCASCEHIEPAANIPQDEAAAPLETLVSQQTAVSGIHTADAGAAPVDQTATVAASAQSEEQTPSIPAIDIKNLCKSYGGFRAVDNLSFTVQQGEIFGLLGPNGSGKTSTINMISGLSGQTSGDIRILGLDVAHNNRQVHRMLGFVPQETALYEELSAWRNMDFHADLFGLPRREKKQRIGELLALVQLSDRKDSLVRTFSGGMKRRLAIARALLHEPSLIYLDEPTIGVDVQARRAIWDYILALRERGKTVLITTNYLEEAEALCDQLAIIDQGKLIVLDTPARLKQLYGGRIIEVDTVNPKNALDALSNLPGVVTLDQLSTLRDDVSVDQNGNTLKIAVRGSDSEVVQVINLLSQKSEIKKISLREPDLDEIFLQLTGATLRD